MSDSPRGITGGNPEFSMALERELAWGRSGFKIVPHLLCEGGEQSKGGPQQGPGDRISYHALLGPGVPQPPASDSAGFMAGS